MFLILGLPICVYCQRAKALLDEMNIPYIYRDVTVMCGNNWRAAFKSAFPSQNAFPVIFSLSDDFPADSEITLESLYDQMLIGNYFDLEDHLEI